MTRNAPLTVALVATTGFFALGACGEGVLSSGGGALEILQADRESGVSGRFALGADVIEFRTLRLLPAPEPTGDDWGMGAAEAGDERFERYLSDEDKIGGVHIAALFVDPVRQVRVQQRDGLEVEEDEDAPFEARERSRALFVLAAEALQQADLGSELLVDKEALARLASGAMNQLLPAAGSRYSQSVGGIVAVNAFNTDPSKAYLTLGGSGQIAPAHNIRLTVCLKQQQLPTWRNFSRVIKCVARSAASATSLRAYERGRFCPAPGREFQFWNVTRVEAWYNVKSIQGLKTLHRCPS